MRGAHLPAYRYSPLCVEQQRATAELSKAPAPILLHRVRVGTITAGLPWISSYRRDDFIANAARVGAVECSSRRRFLLIASLCIVAGAVTAVLLQAGGAPTIAKVNLFRACTSTKKLLPTGTADDDGGAYRVRRRTDAASAQQSPTTADITVIPSDRRTTRDAGHVALLQVQTAASGM